MSERMTRSKRTRLLAAGSIGIIVGIAVGVLTRWIYAPLAGWDAAVVVLVGMIWHDFHKLSASHTAAVARRDDMGHSALDVIVLVTSIASIAAVLTLLTDKDSSLWHVGFGLVSIVLSWIAVHALYTLRYAALYYRDTEGGIDFNSHERPVFSDFAYMSFTIGMTYQIADTNLKTSEIRRVVLGHAFISFIFGMVILATTINFVVGFIGK